MDPQTPPDPALLLEEITALRADLTRWREASRRAEQRLSLALQAVESVVWELSLADQRLFATGAVARLFDQPLTFEVFRTGELIHPEDRQNVRAVWDSHLASGEPFRAEYRINRLDGAELWVEAATETIRAPEGEPQRIIGVIRNITHRRQNQQALARAREAAEAANQAKSDFLANISHEIRTPLNGVLGVVGALARTRLADDQRDMVRLIERSAHVLERLLGDILDISRIEAGRIELKEESFELRPLLHEVASLFESRAREKSVAFFLDVAPDAALWLVGDVIRLRQILSNLLSNAVKFTEAGSVRLSVQVEAVGAGHQALRFEVEDSGIGFDAATARRLFHRFEQADGSITRRYGGTGLGLAISRSLAECMGGALSARSELGQGACFTLTLELPTAQPPAEAVVEALAVQPRPARVLLAEDHPTNRRVVELILAAAGYQIVHVENGAEAVAAAEAQAFDLILMDMQMPVMDGLTAIRHIRARERAEGLPRTPILSLTANAMAEHARASREAGADGHVTKPISAQALLDSVAVAVGPEVQDSAAVA